MNKAREKFERIREFLSLKDKNKIEDLLLKREELSLKVDPLLKKEKDKTITPEEVLELEPLKIALDKFDSDIQKLIPKDIIFIVLHCSASNNLNHDNIRTIDEWHKRQGWKMVGYHRFIRKNGMVENGRPLDDDPVLENNEIGAHVSGNNRGAIGICLSGIGGADFTKEQFDSLTQEIKNLKKNLKKVLVVGHNYFTDKKTCPNFDWFSWVNKHFSENAPEAEKLD